jgi:hypothetical protein
MDKAPLVMDEIDAGETFLNKLNDYRRVKAAFWLRNAEEGERYLYVVLEDLSADNADAAYGEVLRIAGEMRDQYLDPFRVKLISPDNPLAQAVMDIYRRYPGRVPTRFSGSTLGGVAVTEVYIYPPLAATP